MRNPNILFRPLETPKEANRAPFAVSRMRHPVFAWFGLRPVFAQHSRAEHEALLRWGAGRRNVVEIGVAEGASACGLRESMSPEGTLWLIDPFHLSRLRRLNSLKRAAHAAVKRFGKSHVLWIEEFSQKAVENWSDPIDLLFIDGDHQEEAVIQDWTAWSRYVVPGGVTLFHDARTFEGGWPTPNYGPVRAINRLFRTRRQNGWSIKDEVDSLVVVQRGE